MNSHHGKPGEKPKAAMGGRVAGMMAGDKAKDFKGTFRHFLKYMGRYKISVVVVLFFAVLSTIFSIIGPKILGNATTLLAEGIMGSFTGSGQGIDFDGIAQILLFLLGIYIVSSLFSFIQGFIMTGVSMKLTYRLRRDISEKLHRLPLSYYDKTTNGEILSRITNDVDTLSQTLNQSITQIITSVTQLIGILIMMISISWQMTLIALGILPVSFFFVILVVKKSQKQFTAQQKYLGNVNGHVEEMYGGHQVMKAFNGEEESVEQFEEYNDKLYSAAWKSQFLSGIMMPLMTFVTNLGYVAVCVLGGFFAYSGVITIGDIQAFIQYVRQFTQPITQVANITNILQQSAAAAERVFEFLDEPEEVPEAENALTVQDQNEYNKSYNALAERFQTAKARLEEVAAEITRIKSDHERMRQFIKKLKSTPDVVTEFDEETWYALIDHVIVNSREDVRFVFCDGREVGV